MKGRPSEEDGPFADCARVSRLRDRKVPWLELTTVVFPRCLSDGSAENVVFRWHRASGAEIVETQKSQCQSLVSKCFRT